MFAVESSEKRLKNIFMFLFLIACLIYLSDCTDVPCQINMLC